MPLREELERQGKWLFRWRSYLPLLLFLIVIPAVWTAARSVNGTRVASDWGWGGICLAVAMLGVAIRVKTVGHAPRDTSGRNTHGQVAGTLNTTGMYSICRHPLYLGNALMWEAVALFTGSAMVVLLTGTIFWLYYERIMFTEEEFLRSTFGAPYIEWASRTPAFLPAFHRWRPSAIPFSWKSVLRREHSGVLAVVASLALLDLVGAIGRGNRLPRDEMWIALLTVTALSYLILSVLGKRTTLLSTRDR